MLGIEAMKDFIATLKTDDGKYHCPDCQLVVLSAKALEDHLLVCSSSNDWRSGGSIYVNEEVNKYFE